MSDSEDSGGSFRPAVVVTGEGVVYAASSLGSCTRALAAARQELEPYRGALPENIARTFALGHEAEEYGKKWFRDRGWTVGDEQKEVTLELTGRIKVVGHIDFTVDKRSSSLSVIDTKRQSDEEFAKQSIKDSWLWGKYEYQFNAYMLATGLFLTVQRVNDAGDVKLENLEPSLTKHDILRRVLDVEALAGVELKGRECDRQDFPCPYFRVLHDKEDIREVEDADLANVAIHYNLLGIEIAELQDRRKILRGEILKRVEGKVRDRETGIEVYVTKYDTKERVIPAGQGTRVSVRLPDGRDNVARPDE